MRRVYNIHPSSNLAPSDGDKNYWRTSGIETHLVLNVNLGCKTYKVVGTQIVEQ